MIYWRSNYRVLLLVHLRLSRIGVVAWNGRHLIRHCLPFLVKCCEWRAWGCNLLGLGRFWGVLGSFYGCELQRVYKLERTWYIRYSASVHHASTKQVDLGVKVWRVGRSAY